MTKLTLLVLFAGVSLATAHSVRGESLVDWLDARGLPSSRQARAGYWSEFAPNEPYEFSADQNTRLLSALKSQVSAPNLTLITETTTSGANVKAKVESGEEGGQVLGIESELRAQSFTANSGQEISLGSANAAGFYVVRILDGKHVCEGLLFLIPISGSDEFQVDFVAGARSYRTAEAAKSPPASAELRTAIAKFGRTMNSDLLLESAKAAGVPFVRDNIASLGATTVICGTAIFTGGAFTGSCVASATANGLDYTGKTLEIYLDNLANDDQIEEPDRLSANERELILSTYNALNSAVQIGFSWRGASKAKLCKLLESLTIVTNAIAATVEHDNVRMMVMLTVQQSNKFVILVCLKK